MGSYQTAERISSVAEDDAPTVASYFATCDGEIIDEAGDLPAIVGRINDTFKLKGEDVVIWSVWSGEGPQEVARITPGKSGNRVVYSKGGAS